MSRLSTRRPSPAIAISALALFLALGGGAYAAVGSKQIKNGAVTAKKIKNGAVTAKKLRNGAVTAKKLRVGAVTADKVRTAAVGTPKLAEGAVTGAKVDESTLGKVPTVDGLDNLPRRSVAPSATHENAATARANATKIALFTRGPISVYGKCYRRVSGAATELYATAFVELGEPNVAFTTSSGDGSPNNFFGPSTPESDRRITEETSSTGGSPIAYSDTNNRQFQTIHRGGFVVGEVFVAAKLGTPAAGNDAFGGSGDRCLFGGTAWWG